LKNARNFFLEVIVKIIIILTNLPLKTHFENTLVPEVFCLFTRRINLSREAAAKRQEKQRKKALGPG